MELLQIYLSSLAGGAVRQDWSPLMYLVSLHHLSGFLFDQSPPGQLEAVKVRLRMLRQMTSIQDKVRDPVETSWFVAIKRMISHGMCSALHH